MATPYFSYNDPNTVDVLKKMRNDVALRQQMQDEAAKRAFAEQENQLELAQSQQDLINSQQGFGKNTPAAIQEYNFLKNKTQAEQNLYFRNKRSVQAVNLGDAIGFNPDPLTGEFQQIVPKGSLPRNYTNSLGDVSTLPGIPSGYRQGQGNMPNQPQAMPQPPMQQGGMPYEPLDQTAGMQTPRSVQLLVDNGLKVPQNAQGGVDLPAADALVKQYNLTQPMPASAGGMQPPMPQTALQPPVRNLDGTYTYNGRSYRNSNAARDEYNFDKKKEELRLKNSLAIQLDEERKRNEFRVNLPTIESNVKLMLDAIDALEKSPGLNAITGNPLSISKISKGGFGALGNYPGSPAANAKSKLEQIGGKNFLAAYDVLRGTGSIATAEGARAEQAIANLKTTQDPEEFRQSLAVLKDVVKNGLVVARQKAGELPTTQGAAQPMIPAGGNIIQTSVGPVTVTR